MRLVRELYNKATGPVMNDEDQWSLVIDGDRIFVRHAWGHVDVRAATAPDSGVLDLPLKEFLSQPGQGEVHRRLRSLLTEMFPGQALS